MTEIIQALYLASWKPRRISVWGGPPPNQNYCLEGRPLVVQAFPITWVFYEPICISVPAGIVVRGCIQFQQFFWRLFQHVCLFHYGWFMSTSAHNFQIDQQFLTKNVITPSAPPSLFMISPQVTFLFVSPDEKIPQRETFCRYRSGETKKWQEH